MKVNWSHSYIREKLASHPPPQPFAPGGIFPDVTAFLCSTHNKVIVYCRTTCNTAWPALHRDACQWPCCCGNAPWCLPALCCCGWMYHGLWIRFTALNLGQTGVQIKYLITVYRSKEILLFILAKMQAAITRDSFGWLKTALRLGELMTFPAMPGWGRMN